MNGFSQEWVTIQNHRVLLSSRHGYPTYEMRLMAKIAVKYLHQNGYEEARLVEVFYDDKSCTTNLLIASTIKEHEVIEDELTTILHLIYGHGNPQVEFKNIKKGNEESDSYVHTAYLSREALK